MGGVLAGGVRGNLQKHKISGLCHVNRISIAHLCAIGLEIFIAR